MYERGRRRMNKTVLCVTFFLVSIGISASTFYIQPLAHARAYKTIYIRSDFSLDDPTGKIEQLGNHYFLSGDIIDASIRVNASDIVIRGSNYTLGTAACQIYEPGIWVQQRARVTIMNLKIKAFHNLSIYLDGSSNCNISMCNIKNPRNMATARGIVLSHSSNNVISRNVFTSVADGAICLDSSSDNTISKNNITLGALGFNISDSSNNHVYGNNIIDNDIGGGLYGSSNNYIYGNDIETNHIGLGLYGSSSNNHVNGNNTLVFNNKGILIEDSLNNHICGNNITEEDKRTNRIGVHLINSSGNNISENSIEKCYKNGIELWKSSNNTISGNTINQNNNTGVDLYDSSGNNISENRKITENAGHGIRLEISSNNYIYGNMEITCNGIGIYFKDSSGNTISENFIANSTDTGVSLLNSSGNIISENTIAHNNITGISLQHNAPSNFVYHNDLVNKMNVDTIDSMNVWDNGTLNQARVQKRIEGNYWVNYNGTDVNGDEIGDVPLAIDDYNRDNYPLIAPKRPIPFFWNATRYDCRFRANVTVSMLDFNHASSSINFDINLAMSGYCNVTFPSDDRSTVNLQLLKGRFKVLIANIPVAYVLNWNETHTSICFKVSIDQFGEDPPYKVSIQGEIATPLMGDINMDCCVDIYDVVLVSKDFGKESQNN